MLCDEVRSPEAVQTALTTRALVPAPSGCRAAVSGAIAACPTPMITSAWLWEAQHVISSMPSLRCLRQPRCRRRFR
jgi:hypothetical protein